jgi:hypothetical protein
MSAEHLSKVQQDIRSQGYEEFIDEFEEGRVIGSHVGRAVAGQILKMQSRARPDDEKTLKDVMFLKGAQQQEIFGRMDDTKLELLLREATSFLRVGDLGKEGQEQLATKTNSVGEPLQEDHEKLLGRMEKRDLERYSFALNTVKNLATQMALKSEEGNIAYYELQTQVTQSKRDSFLGSLPGRDAALLMGHMLNEEKELRTLAAEMDDYQYHRSEQDQNVLDFLEHHLALGPDPLALVARDNPYEQLARCSVTDLRNLRENAERVPDKDFLNIIDGMLEMKTTNDLELAQSFPEMVNVFGKLDGNGDLALDEKGIPISPSAEEIQQRLGDMDEAAAQKYQERAASMLRAGMAPPELGLDAIATIAGTPEMVWQMVTSPATGESIDSAQSEALEVMQDALKPEAREMLPTVHRGRFDAIAETIGQRMDELQQELSAARA